MQVHHPNLDAAVQEKILAVTRCGLTAGESNGFFRTALGLYYLAGLMTKEQLDFKALDKAFNRFVYRTIGAGHSMTSILQFMSGAKVVAVLESPRFMRAMADYFPEVPVDSIPFLLGLNLGVAKDISKIDARGPVADWLEKQRQLRGGRSMILVPALLALLLGTALVGVVVQLLMLLSRRYTLSWRDGFAYGALVTTAGVAGLLLRFFSGIVLPGVLGAAIAFVFHALIGGWFLGPRVKDRAGHAVQFRRGALLGLLIFVMVLAAGFLFGALQGLIAVRQEAAGI